MKTKKEIIHPDLAYAVVGACFDVHNELGRFAREKQYGDLLAKQLTARELTYEREFTLGNSGNILDFLIERKLILELKTVRVLTRAHYRQVQNYLQQARVELGILVNFADERLMPRRVLRLSDTYSKPFVGLDIPDSDI